MNGKHYILLPSGVLAFGNGMQEQNIEERVKSWHDNITNTAFFLIGAIYFSRISTLLGVAAAYVLGMSVQKVYELYIFEKRSL